MPKAGSEIERNFEPGSKKPFFRLPKWKRPYILALAWALWLWYYFSPNSTVVSHGTIESTGTKHINTAKRMQAFKLEIANNIAYEHVRLDKTIRPDAMVTYKIKDEVDASIDCWWTWKEFEQQAEIHTVDKKNAFWSISEREITINIDFEPRIMYRVSVEWSQTICDESEEKRYEWRDFIKDYLWWKEEIEKRMEILKWTRKERITKELKFALLKDPDLRTFMAEKVFESYIGRRWVIAPEGFSTTLIVNITWSWEHTTHINRNWERDSEDRFKD